MHAPQVTLQSITGVDIQLQVAGAGSRSYAFVIDWHIRLLFAFAWIVVAGIVTVGSWAAWLSDEGMALGDQAWLIFLPAGVIYFFYHPVLEILMRGRTPGKRIAGVRLVSREGDIPGTGALLLRNVFRLIDSLPFAYIVGLVTVMFTEHHVRIGDLAAGTLLVIDEPQTASTFEALKNPQGLDARRAELAHELLERWNQLDETKSTDLARAVLAGTGMSREQLDTMSRADLRERLRELVGAAR